MEDLPEKGNGEEVQGSSLTMEKVAAAKQFIENHYRAQMKNIQERKERCLRALFFFFGFVFIFFVPVLVLRNWQENVSFELLILEFIFYFM